MRRTDVRNLCLHAPRRPEIGQFRCGLAHPAVSWQVWPMKSLALEMPLPIGAMYRRVGFTAFIRVK